jgi:hypothetical protein
VTACRSRTSNWINSTGTARPSSSSARPVDRSSMTYG